MTGIVVGRSAELAAIDESIEGAETGFRALLLEGEAGIGKTTLWEEAVRRARERGFSILAARPATAEVRLSYAGLADLLDAVPAEAFAALSDPQRHALEVALLQAEPEGSPAEARAVAAGLRSVVVSLAAGSPVLLAIDDTQWLDEPSLRAVEFALRRLDAERVCFLATRRTDEAPEPLQVRAPQVVEVGRLRLAAIHELLKARTGRSFPRPILVRLYEASGGNPFFALEIARELIRSDVGPADPLPVPQDLKRLVARRVRRLSQPSREALLAAAALGQPTHALVAAALGQDPSAALEEAAAAEIVELAQEPIRFAHPLYAAAIYSAAPRERRRRLHRRLADVVDDVEERARHLALAAEAPSEDVAAALERAAERARSRGAAAAAAALFGDAGRLTPETSLRERYRRRLAAAEEHFDAADTAAARSILERLLEEMPSGPDRARALLLMALVHYYEDGPAPAKKTCLEALEQAGDDLRLQAEILLRLSLVSADDSELVRSSASRARELVAQDPDAPNDLVAASLLEDAYTRFLAGEGLAHEQVRDAERVLPPHGETWLAQRAHAALDAWMKYTDDLVRARELTEATAERRRAEGDDYEAALIECHLAEIECWLGDWDRARDHAKRAAHEIEQAGNPLWRAVTLYDQALVDAHTGRVGEAREAALEGLELAELADDPWIATLNLSVLGFLDLSVSDLAGADRWLTRAEDAVRTMGFAEPARYRFQGDHIEAVLGLGDLARAEDLVARLEHRAEVAPRPWLLAISARCRGLLHAAAGDLDEADAALRHALSEHERLAMPFERARTLLCLGQTQRRRKERKAARETLAEALEVFETLGAPLWAERTRSEIGRIGVRRAPDELTAGEQTVAELAAQGLKNREIAAKLFMSRRTVEANLERAYRKLGIRSRAELGARMAGPAGRESR